MPTAFHMPYRNLFKHIANPLVDKGWNLHLKFGKGEPQGEQFVQGSSPQEPTTKTDKKEKVSKPQISKQVPLEMGTGDGGGGGGGGGVVVMVVEVRRE